MKISVVTVCFNSAATIRDTLRSVEEQTHSEIEHIVIDGASTDGTASIVRREGRRVSRLISEPDQGIYYAMNKGLALATGEMVGFLNADDTYGGGETVSYIARATVDCPDAVFGDLVYVDSLDVKRVVRRWKSGQYAPGRLRFGWMPPHPTFYVRTDKLRGIGGFDVGLRIASDYDCMLRLMKRPGFRAVYVERVLVHMQIGRASCRERV